MKILDLLPNPLFGTPKSPLQLLEKKIGTVFFAEEKKTLIYYTKFSCRALANEGPFSDKKNGAHHFFGHFFWPYHYDFGKKCLKNFAEMTQLWTTSGRF